MKTMTLGAIGAAILGTLAIGGGALAHGTTHPATTTPATATPAAGAPAAPPPGRQAVTLRFQAMNGATRVRCGVPVPRLGTTGATAQVQDLRFYVSNVRLIRANGSSVPLKLRRNDRYNLAWRSAAVTLIDLENGTGMCANEGDRTQNPYITGSVPRGAYVGLSFTVGVPAVLNHGDPTGAPAPLNLTAMSWNWQAGRKFTKIELVDPGDQAWAAPAFMIHMGSTGCFGNPAAGEKAVCLHANRVNVRLGRITPKLQVIGLDLAKLVGANDVTVNRKGAAGCMSGPTDPECGGVFAALGIDWKADGSGTGLPTTQRQSVFRLIR